MAITQGEIPSGTINGVNTVFTASSSLELGINYIIWDGAPYTGGYTISGNQITLQAPPTASLYISYFLTTPTTPGSVGTITVSQVKTLIQNHRDNLGGLSDAQVIEFMNFVNQYLYPKFASINPNTYLSTRYIKTISGTDAYARPSDFRIGGLKVGGILETFGGSDYYALNFDLESTSFSTTGQTITGATSGATGTLYSITDYGSTGTLIMTNVSGDFQDNEIITGSSEGSATSNGTALGFKLSNLNLNETEFGSQDFGYWLDGSNINFTKPNSNLASRVYVMRYLPALAELTSTSDSTIIPIEYKEYARNVADIYWSQYRKNSTDESLASQRTQQALNDMFKEMGNTVRLIKINGRNNSRANRYRRFKYDPTISR